MVSEHIRIDDNLPDMNNNIQFYSKKYFDDSREGYNIQYFTDNELISEKSNEMYMRSESNEMK